MTLKPVVFQIHAYLFEQKFHGIFAGQGLLL